MLGLKQIEVPYHQVVVQDFSIGTINFPYSAEISCENNDLQPPAYKPAIYKIGRCKKMEWINPNELSPHRSWKYYIIELNSTQLNFCTC